MLGGEEGDHLQVVITVIIDIVIASLNIFNYYVALHYCTSRHNISQYFTHIKIDQTLHSAHRAMYIYICDIGICYSRLSA